MTISAVRGMGGVGKTQLALALAHQLADRFPDGQIALDMRGASPSPLSTQAVMAHVIHSLDPAAEFGDDAEQIAGLYRSVLAGQRVLLVFDNAGSLGQLEPLLPAPPSAVLITSRQKFALPGFVEVDLDVLDDSTAVALLCEICPRVGHAAAPLTRCCGNLPLAIRLIGSMLRTHTDIAPDSLLSNIRAGLARQELTKLDACFEASFGCLGRDQQANWTALGIFPGDFPTGAAAHLWEVSESEATMRLSALAASSLISCDNSNRYRLHDLLRDFARSKLRAVERYKLGLRLAQTMIGYLQRREIDYQAGGQRRRYAIEDYRREAALVAAGHGAAVELSKTHSMARRACIELDDAGKGLRSTLQDPREGLHWARVALATFEAMPWHRHLWLVMRHRFAPLLAARLNSVAFALERANQEAEALNMFARVRGLRGLGPTATAQATRSAARLYSNLGQTELAKREFERALQEATTEEARAQSLIGLANLHGNAGDNLEAAALARKAVVAASETGLESDFLGVLARYELALGNRQEARTSLERALTMSPDKYVTCYTLETLEKMARDDGDLDAQKSLIERRLEAARNAGDAGLELRALVARYQTLTLGSPEERQHFETISRFAESAELWDGYVNFLECCGDLFREADGQNSRYEATKSRLVQLFEAQLDKLSAWHILAIVRRRSDSAEHGDFLAQAALSHAEKNSNRELETLIVAHKAKRACERSDWASARELFDRAWVLATHQQDARLQRSVINEIQNELCRQSWEQPDKLRDLIVRRCLIEGLELLKSTTEPNDAAALLRVARHMQVSIAEPLVNKLNIVARDAAAAGRVSRGQFELLDELRQSATGLERVRWAMEQREVAKKLKEPGRHADATINLTIELVRAGQAGDEAMAVAAESYLANDLIEARATGNRALLLALLKAACRLPYQFRPHDPASLPSRFRSETHSLRELLEVPGQTQEEVAGYKLRLAGCLERDGGIDEALALVREAALHLPKAESLNAQLLEVSYLRQLHRIAACSKESEHALAITPRDLWDALRTLIETLIALREFAAARVFLDEMRSLLAAKLVHEREDHIFASLSAQLEGAQRENVEN